MHFHFLFPPPPPIRKETVYPLMCYLIATSADVYVMSIAALAAFHWHDLVRLLAQFHAM